MKWMNEPKNIITDFLRAKLTDPRARAEATGTDTFTATAGQTAFVLTPSAGMYAYAILTVTVASVSKLKWQEYEIDLQNQTVTLKTGATVGQTVVITYKEGTSNWIYPDLARNELATTSYPRINIRQISAPAERMGNYTAPMEYNLHFQIDIWVKDSYKYDDGDNIWTADKLALRFARLIGKAFSENIIDIYPELYDFKIINIQDADWESDRESHHVIMDIGLTGINIGG